MTMNTLLTTTSCWGNWLQKAYIGKYKGVKKKCKKILAPLKKKPTVYMATGEKNSDVEKKVKEKGLILHIYLCLFKSHV